MIYQYDFESQICHQYLWHLKKHACLSATDVLQETQSKWTALWMQFIWRQVGMTLCVTRSMQKMQNADRTGTFRTGYIKNIKERHYAINVVQMLSGLNVYECILVLHFMWTHVYLTIVMNAKKLLYQPNVDTVPHQKL